MSDHPAEPPGTEPEPDRPSEGPSGKASGPPPPGDPWLAVGYLVSGAVLYGGAGWLLDKLFGTGFLMPVGLVGGVALGVYLIYVRFRVPKDDGR